MKLASPHIVAVGLLFSAPLFAQTSASPRTGQAAPANSPALTQGQAGRKPTALGPRLSTEASGGAARVGRLAGAGAPPPPPPSGPRGGPRAGGPRPPRPWHSASTSQRPGNCRAADDSPRRSPSAAAWIGPA